MVERLVTTDARATAPTSLPGAGLADTSLVGAASAREQLSTFPPDGGTGLTRQARWSWYPPEAWTDEGSIVPKGDLVFPKGAEIHEIKDQNGDFSSGTYMGYNSIFPTAFLHQPDNGGNQ
jgi:hypothetical protein